LNTVKSIDDLIREKNLTGEEFERHRELIEECRAREVQLREYARASRENLKKMSDELDKLNRMAGELWLEARKLSQQVNGIYLRVAPPVAAGKVYH
jgi:hypothetical protein